MGGSPVALLCCLLFLKLGVDSITYQGCYILGSQSTSINGQNDVGLCESACTTDEAFAVSNKKCSCNTLTSFTSGGTASESKCNTICPGNSSQTCGGSGGGNTYISVYTSDTPSVVSATASVTTKAISTSTTMQTTSTTSTTPPTMTITTTPPTTTMTTKRTPATTPTLPLVTSTTSTTSTDTPTATTTTPTIITTTTTSPSVLPTTTSSLTTTSLHVLSSTSSSKFISSSMTSLLSSVLLSSVQISTDSVEPSISNSPSIIYSTTSAPISLKTSLTSSDSTTHPTIATSTSSGLSSSMLMERTSTTSVGITGTAKAAVGSTSTSNTVSETLSSLNATTRIQSSAYFTSRLTVSVQPPDMKLVKVEEITALGVRICFYSQWQPYTQCSSTCGQNALKTRSRTSITKGLCVRTHETLNCGLKSCNPLTHDLELAAAIIQALGCTYLLGIVGATMILCILCRIDTFERLLQFSQELALLLSHVVIWTLANKSENPILCQLSAVLLQYFFIVLFMFLLFESVQVYCVMTNLIFTDGFTTKTSIFVVGWGLPFLYTISTVPFSRYHLTSQFSCWINMDDRWNLSITAPCLICGIFAFIFAEAANMDRKKLVLVSGMTKERWFTAVMAQKGLIIKIPFHLFCWFGAAVTVFYRIFAMYLVVFWLNIALGTVILMFHTLGSEKVRSLLKKSSQKVAAFYRNGRNKADGFRRFSESKI